MLFRPTILCLGFAVAAILVRDGLQKLLLEPQYARTSILRRNKEEGSLVFSYDRESSCILNK